LPLLIEELSDSSAGHGELRLLRPHPREMRADMIMLSGYLTATADIYELTRTCLE
jgi:hypothetical protein